MTPTPPSTTSSQSPDNQYRVVRKRNRVPLSCGPCRHRKLKCNRSHPCENCVRRGDASSCSYAAAGTRKKNQSQGSTNPDDMQNRIDRLEGLVLSLMTNGAQSAGPAAAQAAISRSTSGDMSSPQQTREREDDDMIREEDEGGDSDVDDVSNSLGVLKVDNQNHKAFYYGESHWHLVLKDIAEVKNYFANHKAELENQYSKVKTAVPATAITGPLFLFGSHQQVSEQELRSGLPSKAAVEKLVTRYFNSYDPAVIVLHSPTFHKELFAHWQDPTKTSLVWLALLYSILCLAMQSYNKIGDEPPEWKGKTLDMASTYRQLTVQCLVVSDYTKSVDHTIEALILYVHGEYASRWDAEVSIWVIVGIIARLAMRMGYHRDPKHYPEITPFKGEMRRRVWSFIKQSDTMFSFQLALPNMIRTRDSDTELPRNIFEDEFGPDSIALPRERPNTEPTPVSYMITKARISHEFAVIQEELNAVAGPAASYEEILRHDNNLREIKESMPPHLRLRPIEECTHDPATLLMQRFGLDIFWQKTICILHRKYIIRARQNPRYSHSRRACIDASMAILSHQAQLYRESQPGGGMRTMKWVISSLTKHDFLLAAMLVCLDLNYDSLAMAERRQPGKRAPHAVYFWSAAQRADMISTLETSLGIWQETAEVSIEAFKASRILALILEKVSRTPPPEDPPAATQEGFAAFDEEQPEQQAAMTLGMLSGGLTPNSAAFLNGTGQSPNNVPNVDMNLAPDTSMPDFSMNTQNPFGGTGGVASPFTAFGMTGSGNGLMDMPVNLDWESWDSYIQNGNVDPNFQIYPQGAGFVDPALNDLSPDGNPNPSGVSSNIFMGANTPGRQ